MNTGSAQGTRRARAIFRRALCLALIGGGAALAADDPAFGRVSMKLNFLESGQALPGAVIPIPLDEVDAWVRVKVPMRYPGVRSPKVVLGEGTVTATALIDFAKVLEGQGKAVGAVVAKLVGGEHPVTVAARIESEGGKATVTPTHVEISGVTATGPTLDFLVKTFLLPLFPEAKIGQPFELGVNMERLEVHPDGLKIVIKK